MDTIDTGFVKSSELNPLLQSCHSTTDYNEKLYVINSNLKRRHLTDAQKVKLAHTLKPIYEEKARQNKSLAGKLYGKGIDSSVSFDTELLPVGRVNEIITKEVGISASTYHRGETILEQDRQAYGMIKSKKVKCL